MEKIVNKICFMISDVSFNLIKDCRSYLRNQISQIRLIFLIIVLISSIVDVSDKSVTAQTIVNTINLAPDEGNGIAPVAIDINQETNRVYIANLFSENISVLDGSMHDVIDTVNIIEEVWPKCFPADIKFNSATNKIYMLSSFCVDRDIVFPGILGVLDGTDNKVIKTVSLNNFNEKIGINPDSNRIYLTSEFDKVTILDGSTEEVIGNIDAFGGTIGVNTLSNRIFIVDESNRTSIIDGETDVVIEVIDVGGVAISIDEEGDRVYIGSRDIVNVIDGLSGEILGSINVGANAIGFNPITNRVYIVSNDGTTVVDSTNSEVIDEIEVNGEAIAINSDKNQIYIISYGTIVVMDGESNEIINTVLIGASPFKTVFNPTTNLIYTSNEFSKGINVIDGSNGQITDVINAKGAGLDVDPTSNRIYAISDDGISVIDGLTNDVINEINISGDAIKVNPITNIVYAADKINNSISVIDGTSNTITSVIDVGQKPTVISINQVTNRIYVAKQSSNSLHVIDGESNKVIDIVGVEKLENLITEISVNSVTNRIYATAPGKSSFVNNDSDAEIKLVHVIDGESNEIIDVVSVIASAIPQTIGGIFGRTITQNGIIVDEINNRIYITNMILDLHDGISVDPGVITIIDGFSNKVKSIIDVGSTPSGIAFDSENNLLYLGNRDTGEVAVILDDIEATSTLTVTPVTLSSSLNQQAVIVTALDQTGEPLSNVVIEATISSRGASVSPSSVTTGAAGTAEFFVRFGFVRRDASVTFSAEGKSVIVTLE